MNLQDDIRARIRQNLDAMGRGSRKRLADFLGLTPLQVTRMLNNAPGKEIRVIRADEFEKIRIFFGEPATNFDKTVKPVKKHRLNPARRSRIMDIIEYSSPQQQQALLAFLEAWDKKAL